MKTNRTYIQPQTTHFVLTGERLMNGFGISIGNNGGDSPIEGFGTGYGGGTH